MLHLMTRSEPQRPGHSVLAKAGCLTCCCQSHRRQVSVACRWPHLARLVFRAWDWWKAAATRNDVRAAGHFRCDDEWMCRCASVRCTARMASRHPPQHDAASTAGHPIVGSRSLKNPASMVMPRCRVKGFDLRVVRTRDGRRRRSGYRAPPLPLPGGSPRYRRSSARGPRRCMARNAG